MRCWTHRPTLRVRRVATEAGPRATVLSMDAAFFRKKKIYFWCHMITLAALHARSEPALPLRSDALGTFAVPLALTRGPMHKHRAVNKEFRCPALFSFAQHPALEMVQGSCRTGRPSLRISKGRIHRQLGTSRSESHGCAFGLLGAWNASIAKPLASRRKLCKVLRRNLQPELAERVLLACSQLF